MDVDVLLNGSGRQARSAFRRRGGGLFLELLGAPAAALVLSLIAGFQVGVAAAALRKVTTRTPEKASLGQLFIRKSPIPAFLAVSCMKSLRAISMHAVKRLRRYFTQQTGV
jgi:hypothetical protein